MRSRAQKSRQRGSIPGSNRGPPCAPPSSRLPDPSVTLAPSPGPVVAAAGSLTSTPRSPATIASAPAIESASLPGPADPLPATPETGAARATPSGLFPPAGRLIRPCAAKAFAIASTTPFTKRAASSPANERASSIASSITTATGISGDCNISAVATRRTSVSMRPSRETFQCVLVPPISASTSARRPQASLASVSAYSTSGVVDGSEGGLESGSSSRPSGFASRAAVRTAWAGGTPASSTW